MYADSYTCTRKIYAIYMDAYIKGCSNTVGDFKGARRHSLASYIASLPVKN